MAEEVGTVKSINLKEFLETIPPGRWVDIHNLVTKHSLPSYGLSYSVNFPTLELHCQTESCNGIRFFETEKSSHLSPKEFSTDFVSFKCRNCEESVKIFALWFFLNQDGNKGRVFKFGEVPPFGPPTPTRLLSIIGAEKEYFLKGRRAENQGLGIAAFAYYRRVIENQKTRILDEIIKVSEKLAAPREVLEDLRAAREEIQFSKAVASIKHGIPQVLLINGHNPLTLLHGALSEGLHAQTDEQCLELATGIRVVMSELAENLSQAFKDEAELNAAVTRLLKGTAPKEKE